MTDSIEQRNLLTRLTDRKNELHRLFHRIKNYISLLHHFNMSDSFDKYVKHQVDQTGMCYYFRTGVNREFRKIKKKYKKDERMEITDSLGLKRKDEVISLFKKINTQINFMKDM